MSFKLRMRRTFMRQGVALLLLTFLIAAFAILFVGARSIKTELDALVFADSDNLGWNISQLDVDYRGLHAALLEPLIEASEAGTEITQSELAQVKLAFDIFYRICHKFSKIKGL